jgi:SAM-dependent methyltransferase
MMRLKPQTIPRTCPEPEIFNELVSLDGMAVLELGCGAAELTRIIATEGSGRSVVAFEIDEVQHALNLQIEDLPNVIFAVAGAESIPAVDDTFDVAFMFKSLHHVPVELMGLALDEIRRVLVPGGLAYISEPIFDGDFNEVLRLFHDESQVRAAAFDAIKWVVDSGSFELVSETFFKTPRIFANFAEFEDRVIGATHSCFELSDELRSEVRSRFEHHMTDQGVHFFPPNRVDLLRRPL